MANTKSAKKAARQMIAPYRGQQVAPLAAQGPRAQGRGGDGLRRQGRRHERAGGGRADSHAHRPEGRHPQENCLAQGLPAGRARAGAGLNARIGIQLFTGRLCLPVAKMPQGAFAELTAAAQPESARLQRVARGCVMAPKCESHLLRGLGAKEKCHLNAAQSVSTRHRRSARKSTAEVNAFSPGFDSAGTVFPPPCATRRPSPRRPVASPARCSKDSQGERLSQ